MESQGFSNLQGKLDRLIWKTDPDRRPAWQRRLIFSARLAYALARDLTQGQLTLHAMSLVYTTLLSIVPLLAVSFSVLKGFGVHNQIEPILIQALAPLGDQSDEIAEKLIGYVDNINVGVLGSLGLAFLLYSVLSLVSKIELVFNLTWHVDRQRGFAQRVSRYLSVLLIGPVLFFSAVGATASVRSAAIVQWLLRIEPFGLILEIGTHLLPYALIVLAFAFAYAFVPNTRVKLRSALIGALVAGLLWQSAGYAFATFMAGSTRYTAIYSGLAILILFMIWVYIAWLILLIGASIAFYTQNPEFLATRAREIRLSNRLRERVTLCLATEVASRHLRGEPPCTAEELARVLRLPTSIVRRLLVMLCRDAFLIATADEPPRYVPARAPATVSLSALVGSIRRYDERDPGLPAPACSPQVLALQERLEQAVDEALAERSLAELADPREGNQSTEPYRDTRMLRR
jgi:membrane protein